MSAPRERWADNEIISAARTVEQLAVSHTRLGKTDVILKLEHLSIMLSQRPFCFCVDTLNKKKITIYVSIINFVEFGWACEIGFINFSFLYYFFLSVLYSRGSFLMLRCYYVPFLCKFVNIWKGNNQNRYLTKSLRVRPNHA